MNKTLPVDWSRPILAKDVKGTVYNARTICTDLKTNPVSVLKSYTVAVAIDLGDDIPRGEIIKTVNAETGLTAGAEFTIYNVPVEREVWVWITENGLTFSTFTPPKDRSFLKCLSRVTLTEGHFDE